MKRDRQLKKNDKQLRPLYVLLLCVTVFSLLFLMAVGSKAADPAADYPSRPIEYVTWVGPGATFDVIGRLMSDIIQKEKILSQPLVVVNKVGSGGAVACGYVFEKKGNPHIVLGASTSALIVTPMQEKLPYNYKSFTPIANLLVDGAVLVVRADSPFKTAEDIIAEAKKRPKELIQGGQSFISAQAMMGRMIQKVKGVQWSFLSFAGGGPEAALNILSGNVHFAFIDPSQVIDYVRAGKLRVLLTGAPNRYREFKDVPTISEAGMGEPIVVNRGLVGPPNMPDYAVKKLVTAFKKVMDSDRFKKYMEDSMMQPSWTPSDEFSKLQDKMYDQWKVWLSELDLLKKK